MSAISAVWLYVGWGAVHFETNYGLMQHSPFEIKEKLLKALDREYNVVDMAAVVEIVSILERTAITKEALETTRLGRYINELRRKTSNDSLAKRAKDLVRRWRDMILPTSGATEQPPAPAPSGGATQQPPVAAQNGSGVRAPPPPPTPRTLSPASSNTSPSGATTHHDTAAVPRTHASNKRLRKEADCAAAQPAKKPKLNGASLPVLPAAPLPDECSRDSGATNLSEIVTICDDDDEPNHPPPTDTESKLSSSKTKKSRQKDKKSSNLTSSSSEKRRSKSDKKRLGSDDILKEKIASIARTPRVKTTQELVADLRSRRNSETAVVDSDVKVANDAAAGVCDELVLSRNKSEHLEKFLRSQKHESDDDSVVVVDLVDESERSKKKSADVKERPTKDHKRSKQATEKEQSESANPERTLQEILSRLPPLDLDSIVWDESPPVSPPPPREITQDDVDRLHNENVENLNGNYDHAPPAEPHSSTTDSQFREWHETVSRTSYNGELLHILPYVVID